MAGIPELAAGRLSLFADTSTVGKSIGRVFKGGDKEASKAGARWGQVMAKSFDKAKPDMQKFADDVAKAEKRITDETKRRGKAQELANAKAEVALAKLNEAIENHGKESVKAKQAAVQLMTAQNNVEKANLAAADSLKKLNRELDEAKEAYSKGEKAAGAYAKSWRGVGERIGKRLKGELRDGLDTDDQAKDAGDEAADAYARGWNGLGTTLTYHVVTAIAVAGVAGVIAAKVAGNKSGDSFAEGFTKGIGNLSGARVLSDLGSGLTESLGNMDKSVPKIALVSSAVLTLSGALLAGIANTAGFIGALSSIGPAALALPGLLASGGLAAGVFAMAMVDVEDKLNDTILTLEEFRGRISNSFWAEAQQPIGNLINVLLPALEGGISNVGTALGSLVAAFAVEIQGSLPSGELAAIVAYTEESLWKLHAAVAPVTESLMTLGTVGASYMPALSGWVVELTTNFNSWLQAAEADGRLRGWIDDGIQGMKDLGSGIWSLVGAFNGVGNAMEAGGFSTTLAGFADGMERINQAINGPVGQEFLTHIFTGAKGALDALGPGLSSFSDAIITLGPTLESVLTSGGAVFGQFLHNIGTLLENPVFQRGLTDFMEGALAGMEALQPAMGPLGELFGVIAQTAGLLAAELGGTLGTVIAELAPIIADLLLGIQPLIPVLGDLLVSAVQTLAPIFMGLAIIFVEDIVPALIKLSEWIIKNEEWFWKVVAVVAAVVAALVWLAPMVLLLGVPLGTITLAVTVLVLALWGLWEGAKWVWNAIKNVISTVVTWFVTTLVPWFQQKIAELMFKWEHFKAVVAAVWQAVKDKINAIWVWFSTSLTVWFANKLAWLGSKWQAFKDRVSEIWDGFKTMLYNGWAYIRDDVFGKFVSWVTEDIPNAFEEAKNGIGEIWDKIVDKVKEPIRIVVEDVINGGLIAGYNGLNDFWSGKDIDPISLPAGFAEGGHTGPGGKYKPAGIVHADEFVVKKSARRKFEKNNPGVLDHINSTGDLPSKSQINSPGFNHGAYAMGPPGGPGGGIWGALQNQASASGKLYVSNRGVGGVNMESVAKAWMGQSALDIRMGNGSPGLNVASGGPGGWGFYSGNTMYLNPNGPSTAADKAGTLRHELGHALSLHHTNSTASIMHPQMRGGNWPHSGDYSTLRRVWGNPGKGVRKYSAAEAGAEGGGFDIMGFITEKLIGPFTGAFDTAKSSLSGNGFAEMPLGLATKGKDDAVKWAMDKLASVGEFVNGAVDRTKVTAWMTTALLKKGMASPGNIISGVNRAFKESSGNPNAVQQIQDINSGGNEARGLMQVTPRTFQAHKEPGFGNIFGALDNILASINYTMSRYGSLTAGWNLPGGYADGGLVTESKLYDKGGKLPTGRGVFENKTGKTEAVLTDEQWRLQARNADFVAKQATSNPGINVQVVAPEGTSNPYEFGTAIGTRIAFEAGRR